MADEPSINPGSNTYPRWFPLVVCMLLVGVTLLVYGFTLSSGFVNLDDDLIVYQNPHVTGGLSFHSAGYAFTHFDSNFYIPLTLLSHALDWQIFGSDAGGHHFVNVLLHAISAAIFFLVLLGMTSAPWQSAFVAAVFALHPLHVESVAWVSERKDVLSGLFFMLTLGAYAGYASRPFSTWRYMAVVVAFGAGLFCKPVLVTVPVVLLLLDGWPLGRFASAAGDRRKTWLLFLEKVPLLFMAAAASVVAVIAEGNAVMPMEKFPLRERLANAVISYVIYIRQTLFPMGLAPFYPHPGRSLSTWGVAAAFLAMAGISVASVMHRRKSPWFFTGWMWFVVMLLPMIGIVQVGTFGHADRFMYLPQTGLVLVAACMASGIAARSRPARPYFAFLGVALIAEYAAITSMQSAYWKNSETLWTRTLECTDENAVAHNNLGEALLQNGNSGEAEYHFAEAVRIDPARGESYSNLGVARFLNGQVDESIESFEKAIEFQPGKAELHNNLANALVQKGRIDEAMVHYRKALEINPAYTTARQNLDKLLREKKTDVPAR